MGPGPARAPVAWGSGLPAGIAVGMAVGNGGPVHVSGGYHLPSEANHHPGPCDASLMLSASSSSARCPEEQLPHTLGMPLPATREHPALCHVRAVPAARITAASAGCEIARRQHEQARAGIGIANVTPAQGRFVRSQSVVEGGIRRCEPRRMRLREWSVGERITHVSSATPASPRTGSPINESWPPSWRVPCAQPSWPPGPFGRPRPSWPVPWRRPPGRPTCRRWQLRRR